MSGSSDQEALWVDRDSEVEMDTWQVDDGSFEITMETEMDGTVSPSYQKRRNTWPGSLLTAKALKASEELDDTEGEKSATNTEEPSSSARKMSTRRNAWGNMSYAEMITSAIESTPEKRMTLAQIYDWIVKNVSYFQDKGDNSSSAGWKNSVRHNLSLHSQFSKLQNEGTGKSSWWVVNPEAAIQRRRARTMESGVFDRKRGKGRLKMLGSTPATISTIDESQSEPGTRCRSGSCASSLGRLSPIQAEAESESALDEWSQPNLAPRQSAAAHCLAPASKGSVASEPAAQLPAAGNVWQNFTITLKDSAPLVAAPVPTTVLFMDQPVQSVSAAVLPSNRGMVAQQAPMIVLLTSPRTALPQYIQSSSSCVAIPSSLPSNAIPCVSLSSVHAVRNVSDTSGTATNQPKQSSLRAFLRNSDSSAAVRNDSVPSCQSQEITPSSSSLPESRSVSQHYLQFLKLLSSKQMREYMKLKPGFSEKFRKLLLAKREKMLREMNGRQTDGSKSTACRSIYSDVGRLPKVEGQPANAKPNRMHLEESMNLISLNSENSTMHPSPSGSKTQQSNFPSSFDDRVQQQVEALDLDFEQVVNHELEHDLLLDFNFDNLAGDLGCDDDFLNQF